MNIFRLAGDISHLVAIIILLQKIWKTRSCSGEYRTGLSPCLSSRVLNAGEKNVSLIYS